ncbi:GNAT family N-acetyltransferase [Streptomyces sp. KL116D]|uniref:GNAT family N-acetyltransferase n=1 Tax=Streptomyces sp. KL116D TaxID=3045152 RepID=UPI0035579AA7
MDIRIERVSAAEPGDRRRSSTAAAAAVLDGRAARPRGGRPRLVTGDATVLLVARAPEGIVGTLTLALLPLPSGLRGRVEDVVVDAARGGASPPGSSRRPAGSPRRPARGRWTSPRGRSARRPTGSTSGSGFRARESTVYRRHSGETSSGA